MTRIDDALRRQRASGDTAPEDGVQAPAGDDPFVAPWSFDSLHSSESELPAAHRGLPAAEAGGGALPGEHALAVFRGFSAAARGKLVGAGEMLPAALEQYRSLAAALHHAQTGRGIRTVMVTSAAPAEGKTLTATNLALTLSESYKRRVLLVDADLRRPAIHELFQVPNVCGLGDGLDADPGRGLPVIQITPRLVLLPAGRPDVDPMGALSSARMQKVIDEAAAQYDWVVIDTPPVGLLPDANVLAAMIDVALLVVQAAKTPLAVVQRAVQAVGRDRIIGVVLNGADVRDSRYGYGYGYGRYRR